MSSPGAVPDVVHPVVHPDGSPDGWREAWTSALRDVELDVDVAEELLAELHRGAAFPEDLPIRPWSNPSVPGPLPADLADLAARLLQRQLDVGQQLAEAIVHARSHRRALGRMEPAEHVPVFFDTPL